MVEGVEGGTILYRNVRRARRVRWLIFGSLPCGILFSYLAFNLLLTYGLSPADGGDLRPLSERWALAALLITAALAPLIGMLFYGGLYLVRIERRGSLLVLSTVRPFGTKVQLVDLGAVTNVRFHEGEFEGSNPTPYLALRLRGLHAALIADLGAEYVDRQAIEKLCDASCGERRTDGRWSG